jgi:hypothetical protein
MCYRKKEGGIRSSDTEYPGSYTTSTPRDMARRDLLLSPSLLTRVRPLIMSAFANHDPVIPIERDSMEQAPRGHTSLALVSQNPDCRDRRTSPTT